MSKPSYLLPRTAYLSPEWFAKEQEQLFGNTWQFIGLEKEMPAIGSYRTLELGSYALVLLRDEQGELRLLHNLCRHRGMPLFIGAGKLEKHIRCPYHNWTYQQDGQLRAVPQKEKFPCLAHDQLGLHQASLDTWHGMVFAHPQSRPEPLEEWVEGLAETLGAHQLDQLEEQETLEYSVKANWKLFIENYMDGYHLRHLHSRSLGSHYDHDAIEQGQCGPHWYFYQPLTASGQRTANSSSSLPLISGQASNSLGAYVHLLFPNLGITATESIWSLLEILPQGPELTLVRIRSWCMPISTLRYMLLKAPEIKGSQDHPAKSGNLMEEDIYVCESIQRSMHSPAFKVGPLAEGLEEPIWHFQRNIMSYLGAS